VTSNNGNKPNTPACPYCANPNLFDEAIAAATGGQVGQLGFIYRESSKRIYRGDAHKGHKVRGLSETVRESEDFTLKPITDKDLAERYSGFRIEIIGMKLLDDPPSPPGPFFHKSQHVTLDVHDSVVRSYSENVVLNQSVPEPQDVTSPIEPSFYTAQSAPAPVGRKEDEDSPTSYWHLFNACRITKKGSKVTVDVHWWPDHGRKVTISNLTPAGPSAADLEVINQAVKFFRVETRGRGKVTEDKLRAALASLGPSATMSATAKELKLNEGTLEKWRQRKRINSWREVVNRYT
jgi:hypothetical protein